MLRITIRPSINKISYIAPYFHDDIVRFDKFADKSVFSHIFVRNKIYTAGLKQLFRWGIVKEYNFKSLIEMLTHLENIKFLDIIKVEKKEKKLFSFSRLANK